MIELAYMHHNFDAFCTRTHACPCAIALFSIALCLWTRLWLKLVRFEHCLCTVQFKSIPIFFFSLEDEKKKTLIVRCTRHFLTVHHLHTATFCLTWNCVTWKCAHFARNKWLSCYKYSHANGLFVSNAYAFLDMSHVHSFQFTQLFWFWNFTNQKFHNKSCFYDVWHKHSVIANWKQNRVSPQRICIRALKCWWISVFKCPKNVST